MTWCFTTLPHRQCKCPLCNLYRTRIVLGFRKWQKEKKNWMLPSAQLQQCSLIWWKFTQLFKEREKKKRFPNKENEICNCRFVYEYHIYIYIYICITKTACRKACSERLLIDFFFFNYKYIYIQRHVTLHENVILALYPVSSPLRVERKYKLYRTNIYKQNSVLGYIFSFRN